MRKLEFHKNNNVFNCLTLNLVCNHYTGCSVGSPDFVKLFEAYGYPDGQHLTTSDGSVIYDTITQSWELAKKQGVAVIVVHQGEQADICKLFDLIIISAPTLISLSSRS